MASIPPPRRGALRFPRPTGGRPASAVPQLAQREYGRERREAGSSSPRGGACVLGLSCECASLEEECLVDARRLALGGGEQQFIGHDHQAAQIALCMVGPGGAHFL